MQKLGVSLGLAVLFLCISMPAMAVPSGKLGYDSKNSAGAVQPIQNTQLMRGRGPLLTNVAVQPVFFGNVTHATEIDNFYEHVVQSPWMNVLSQYSVGQGTAVPGLHMRAPSNLALTQKDVEKLLLSMVSNGHIVPTAMTYVPVHFSPGFVITARGGSVSCKEWCGIHDFLDLGSLVPGVPNLYFGMIPNFGVGTNCDGGCGKGEKEIDNICSVASHELAEAITDPVPWNGWYNKSNEIGDLCNG
ncbi:hypothetical protein HDU98_003379 [Podochytrium sp. JEL0797]|nr:hypothetical protein HDU98_003379 [Podochytrium sp. JEL0797]